MPDDAPKLEPLADGLGYRVRVRYARARDRIRIPTTDETLAALGALVLVLGAALGSVPSDLAKSLLEQAG